LRFQIIEIEKRIWLLYVLIFFSAFLVRFYLVLFSSVITPDGILYIKAAKFIESGKLENIAEFTLYPFLIVLAHKIFPDWEMAGRMVSVLMGSLTVIPLFLLAKRMFDVRVALVIAFFYIINPRLADYSADVLREPTFWFFSMMALWLAWEGISRNSFMCTLLSSFATGLSVITRTEGMAIFLLILLWIFWSIWRSEHDTKKLFFHLIIFVFLLPVMFLPLIVIFKEKYDIAYTFLKTWYFFRNKNNGVFELTPDKIQAISPGLSTFLELAKGHKYVIFLSEIIVKLVKSLNVVFFFFAVIGIFGRKSIAYSKNEVPVAIWFSVFFITAFFYITQTYYFSTRHGLLLGFPLLIWAGIGFIELKEQLCSWFKRIYPSAPFTKHMAVILIFAILIAILPKALSPGGYEKRELKEAGAYLKAKGYSGAIFAGEPGLYRVAFYAGSEFIPLPFVKKEEELADLMRENKAEFLILDKKTGSASYKDILDNLNASVFTKVDLPELERYKEYTLSLYRLKGR